MAPGEPNAVPARSNAGPPLPLAVLTNASPRTLMRTCEGGMGRLRISAPHEAHRGAVSRPQPTARQAHAARELSATPTHHPDQLCVPPRFQLGYTLARKREKPPCARPFGAQIGSPGSRALPPPLGTARRDDQVRFGYPWAIRAHFGLGSWPDSGLEAMRSFSSAQDAPKFDKK